jgi:hypothetical protein
MSNEAPTPNGPQPAAASQPQHPAAKKINMWTSADKECPRDLVVNAGNRPCIIAALHAAPRDQARIDVGDRRQGEYYADLVRRGLGQGLQFVCKLPTRRLAELEKMRAIRTGEEPADWIKEVWAKKGKESPARRDGVAEELARLSGTRID